MKKQIGSLFTFLFFSLWSNAYTITNPVVTRDPANVVLNQSNTWTFDFTSSDLTGTENLVIYFWQPISRPSFDLKNLGNKIWSLTFTPTTFFNLSVAEIAADPDKFWFNIQDRLGGVTGSLNTPFTTPVSTPPPVEITNIPSGIYPLDQQVTWFFDLSGSGFKSGQDLYMWAWSPSNPDTDNYSNSSEFTKLTFVSGMVWSMTLTPTVYFNKTVSEIQSAGFWMKLKDKTGKIETNTFQVPFTDAKIDITSIAVSGNDITSSGASSQMSVIYTPANAYPRPVEWSVDDSSIAAISATGLLSARKNGVVTVTASIIQNSQTISASKQISISNQITELYLIGLATPAGEVVSEALPLNRAMGTTADYINGLFEISTTLNQTGSIRFISSKTDPNPLVYGQGSGEGTVAQNGTDIISSVSGEVLIRVNLANKTYKIYPINPLRISQMGSSVSFGWGATNNQGYAYLYNQLLSNRFNAGAGQNWTISNISIGGNATPDLLNRWETDLLNDNSKFVVYALSLGNEGIMGGGQAKFDQFKNNMLLLINKARSAGKIPVIANCYAHGAYTLTEYNFVKQMNLLIHEWDVASYNFLGADDDETGKWVSGYVSDDAHPNTEGHIEFYHAIVPSLFDALVTGKPQPAKQPGNSFLSLGSLVTTDNYQLTPENIVHSFTNVIDIRTTSTGVIGTFSSNNMQGKISINDSGLLSYNAPDGTPITGTMVVNDGQWHKITLSHNYALGKTNMYSDNNYIGSVSEKLNPTSFSINTDAAPSTIDYRDWMFYRSALNQDEISALNAGKMLKSSLEIYSPLDGQKLISADTLLNLAQSINKIQKVIHFTGVTIPEESKIRIFPNPVQDKITFDGIKSGLNFECLIYSVDGTLKLKNILNDNQVNVTHMLPGTYYLMLKEKKTLETCIIGLIKK